MRTYMIPREQKKRNWGEEEEDDES